MNQAIPAEDEIDLRQRVADYVEVEKAVVFIRILASEFADNLLYDIDADVGLQIQFDFFQPMEIPTSRVQQSAHAELLQESRDLIAKGRCADDSRTGSGYRFAVAPGSAAVDV